MIVRFGQDQLQRAKDELELAGLQALRFVAAVLGPVKHSQETHDRSWALALLRVVNSLDLGDPRMASQILAEAINRSSYS